MKIIVFFMFYILVCENVFSQTKIYSWNEIKDCTITYDRVIENSQSEKERLSKQLHRHISKFKKHWRKYHILISKEIKRNMLKTIDCLAIQLYYNYQMIALVSLFLYLIPII